MIFYHHLRFLQPLNIGIRQKMRYTSDICNSRLLVLVFHATYRNDDSKIFFSFLLFFSFLNFSASCCLRFNKFFFHQDQQRCKSEHMTCGFVPFLTKPTISSMCSTMKLHSFRTKCPPKTAHNAITALPMTAAVTFATFTSACTRSTAARQTSQDVAFIFSLRLHFFLLP